MKIRPHSLSGAVMARSGPNALPITIIVKLTNRRAGFERQLTGKLDKGCLRGRE
jgi:hypothetical protein